MLIILLFGIAVIVGLIAGSLTYFINYNEYQHHLNGERVYKESIKSGVVSFIFFFIITIVIALIIFRLFK